MPEDKTNQDTQPIALKSLESTQPVPVQKENNPLGVALPGWILDWAANETPSEPHRDVLLADVEEAQDFAAPTLDEGSGWQTEPITVNPLTNLETHLQDGDFVAVLSLVRDHKTDPTFRSEAAKALRKHLNLDDLASPLWEANDLLNNEQSGDE